MKPNAAMISRFCDITLRNIVKRKWISASIMASSCLVVLVLVGFLAMAEGFRNALHNTGSATVAMVMGNQAQNELSSQLTREQIDLLASAPGIAQRDNRALLSPELSVVVGAKKQSDDSRVNVTLRGMGENGPAMRDGFRLLEGRRFNPGHNEIIVGAQLARDLQGITLGSTLRLGGADWTIVGIFALQGNLFETEFWADITSVQSAYGRQNQFHSVRARLLTPAALVELAVFAAQDVRLDLNVQTEKDYFAKQSEGMVNLIAYVAWPLALLLSIGTFAGIYNAMQISVEARQRELVILRQIGFTRRILLFSVLLEAVLCSLAGAVLGGLVAFVLFDGLLSATIGSGFASLSYALSVSGTIVMQALMLAGAVAALAVLVPAYRGVSGRLTL